MIAQLLVGDGDAIDLRVEVLILVGWFWRHKIEPRLKMRPSRLLYDYLFTGACSEHRPIVEYESTCGEKVLDNLQELYHSMGCPKVGPHHPSLGAESRVTTLSQARLAGPICTVDIATIFLQNFCCPKSI